MSGLGLWKCEVQNCKFKTVQAVTVCVKLFRPGLYV